MIEKTLTSISEHFWSQDTDSNNSLDLLCRLLVLAMHISQLRTKKYTQKWKLSIEVRKNSILVKKECHSFEQCIEIQISPLGAPIIGTNSHKNTFYYSC